MEGKQAEVAWSKGMEEGGERGRERGGGGAERG